MQDRYAGDIGDYGKIALLRFLHAQGFSIGVNWYRVAEMDSEKNADGSYKQNDGKYLISEKLRECDPTLADHLMRIAHSKRRSISSIQKADLIPGAVYFDTPLSVESRSEWHQKAMDKLAEADLVFMDPDNGLKVKSVGKRSAKSIKYTFYEEVKDYIDAGKSVLIYNHRCRKPEKEYFDDIEKKLQDEVKVYWAVIQAITFPKGSIRDYFAIPACEEHAKLIKKAYVEMSESIWGQLGVCKLHPEWAKDIPLHYMTYDDHIFMEIESETFNKACSFEQYKRDIIRYLMHSSWHYSEKTAKAIVKNEMEYIQKSFKKKDTIADVAVEIGYGCG